MNITISIKGDTETVAKIKRLGQSLMKFQDANDEIGEYVAKYSANEAMASQGQVFGESWPRLSASYAARKAKSFAGAGPLIASGRMKDSFQYDANDTSVRIGNTAPQFKYHQSSAPRTKIPRRKMIGMNNVEKSKIASIYKADIRKKIDNA